MEKADTPTPTLQKRRYSISFRFRLICSLLFLVILIGGTAAFTFAMLQILRSSTGQELTQTANFERLKLESSVNSEIALALKMATSPIVIRHFLDPTDPSLKRMAFDEIEAYRQSFTSGEAFWASDVDKEFYFAEDDHYTIDTSSPDNYWYEMTLYETESFNFNINYNPEMQRTMLFLNAPVFNNGQPIGLVGTSIDLTEFVDSIFRDYTGKADLYLFNNLHEITGARDVNLIANKVPLDEALGRTGTSILNTVSNMESGSTQFIDIRNGEASIAHIPSLDWYITAIQPIVITDVFSNTMSVVFFTMMALIAIIFVVFLILVQVLLIPLKKMIASLEQISTDWDLTHKIEIDRTDEIGILADFFNLTFEKIRGLILDIRCKTNSLSKTGEELASNMTQNRAEIGGINGSIQNMRTQVLSQSDKVNAAADSMDHVISELNQLNGHISIQAESVARSSSAIEQMIANIESVTRTLVKNSENINSLSESAENSRIDLQKVSSDIQDIARESEGLLEINAVMQNIASQTNLLSMNAAIEAAHAGESGKGFAVVADEIRKLAENSSEQSKTISNVLKKIKDSIDIITKSTSVVLERFAGIQEEVQIVSVQENQIRNAMEEQSEGSRQILEAVTQLNNVTGLVRDASSDMTKDSTNVLNQSKELKTITSEVACNMDEITKNTDEISSAIIRVQEITMENEQHVDSLTTDISRFKIDQDQIKHI
jgi:methyl-accepting chemotaxis protein